MCEHMMTVQRGQCGFLSSTELRPPILLAKSSLVRNMAITALFFCENQGLEPKNQGLEPKIPGLEDWVIFMVSIFQGVPG